MICCPRKISHFVGKQYRGEHHVVAFRRHSTITIKMEKFWAEAL
jgi:hypothetical protein